MTTIDPALFPAGLSTGLEGAQSVLVDGASAISDFDSFLTLLTAELQNQDPLDPIDSTEFVSQLASFSTVEQQVSTNERLQALSEASAAGAIAGFAGWIGRDVATTDGRVAATGASVALGLPAMPAAQATELRIRDQDGVILARLPVTPADLATGSKVWDGTDATGAAVSGQTVRISVAALEQEEVLEERPARIFAPVVALSATPEGPVLDRADGLRLRPEEISELRSAVGG